MELESYVNPYEYVLSSRYIIDWSGGKDDMFVRQDLTPMPELLSKHRLESQDNKEYSKKYYEDCIKLTKSKLKENKT